MEKKKLKSNLNKIRATPYLPLPFKIVLEKEEQARTIRQQKEIEGIK